MQALFDAGYAIKTSDKRGGVVTAERAQGSMWSATRGGDVQIKLEATSASRTSVRISTTCCGQQRVDEERIKELATLIERRLLGVPGTKKP